MKWTKITSIVLSIAILLTFSTTFTVQAETERKLSAYNLNIVAYDYPDSTITVYENQGQFLMNMDDIEELTRVKIDLGDKTLVIHQGIREIRIDMEKGTLSEFGDTYDFTVIKQGNQILVHAYPLLMYLGANCFMSDNVFFVLMPAKTLWESLDFDIRNYYMDMVEYYGGENWKSIAFANTVFMDIISPSGHGAKASRKNYIRDAYHEILGVDLNKFDSTQKELSKMNSQTSEIMKDTKDKGILEPIQNLSSLFLGDVPTLVDSYKSGNLIHKLNQQRGYSLGTSQYEKISDISKKITENGIKKANLDTKFLNQKRWVPDAFEVLQLGKDFYLETQTYLQYDENTKKLISNVLSKEKLASANCAEYDLKFDLWLETGENLSNLLSSTQQTFLNNFGNMAENYLKDKIVEIGFEELVKLASKKGNIYILAINIGLSVTDIIMRDFVEAMQAELKVIMLSEIHELSYGIFTSLLDITKSKKYSDYDSNKQLQDTAIFYCRTAYAMFNNFHTMFSKTKHENSDKNMGICKKLNNKLETILTDLALSVPTPIIELEEVKKNNELDKGYKPKDSDRVVTINNTPLLLIGMKYKDIVKKYGKVISSEYFEGSPEFVHKDLSTIGIFYTNEEIWNGSHYQKPDDNQKAWLIHSYYLDEFFINSKEGTSIKQFFKKLDLLYEYNYDNIMWNVHTYYFKYKNFYFTIWSKKKDVFDSVNIWVNKEGFWG